MRFGERILRKDRPKHGICLSNKDHKLSQDDIKNGFVSCRKCRVARRPAENAKNKRRYKAAKKAKKCTTCKRNNAIEGISPLTKKPYQSCDFCLDRRQDYRKEIETERVDLGLCPCGGVREDKDKKYCRTCRTEGSKRSYKSYHRASDACRS